MASVKIAALGSIGLVVDRDAFDLPPEAFSSVQNVRFTEAGAESVLGFKRAMRGFLFAPQWFTVVPPEERPLWLYADTTRAAAFDGVNHQEITRVSGPYFGSAERWNSTIMNGVLYLNNTQDIPQIWSNFGLEEPLVNLPNWPSNLRCKFLRSFKSTILIAGFMTENGQEHPYRIHWSHPARPGEVPLSWNVGDPTRDSRSFDLGESADYVVDGLTLGDLFIVYREKSAYALQYVGAPNFFRSSRMLDDVGLLTRDCVASYSKGHFCVGVDDVYTHSGQRNGNVSLVEQRTRKWLFNQISPEFYKNSFVVKYTRRNEVWFCYPEVGETYPTMALIWNTSSGGIGFRQLPGAPWISPGPVATGDDFDFTWGV